MIDSGALCMPKVEKVQKTVMVPRDLYDLAADQENVAGVPFTRIVLAALCKYFFDEPDGPNPEWMSMAVALDRGDINIWQVPVTPIKSRLSLLESMLSTEQRRAKRGRPAQFPIPWLEHEIGRAQEAVKAWEEKGFEEKFGPEEQAERARRESTVRGLTPEELAQMPEPQDDAEDNS